MSSGAIELVLLKQLAGYLTTPIFVVDPEGRLVYYNEPAAQLLGYQYEETGEMPLEEWGTMFTPTDSLGREIPPERLPLALTLAEGHPTHASIRIVGMDGVARRIAITAMPLENRGGTDLGAMALFWELPR